MALNFYELKDSRQLSRKVLSKDITFRHMAMYSDDQGAVYTAYRTLVGVSFDALPLQDVRCAPLGAGVWKCEADFGWSATTQTDSPTDLTPPADTDPLGPSYSFDITAQQIHVTQSRGTRYRWGNVPAAARGQHLRVDGTDNRLVGPVAPDTGVPAVGDIGKKLVVVGQNNWVGGVYTITNATASGGGGFLGQWTLAASPGPVNTAGGWWTLWDGTSAGGAADYKQAIGVTTDRVEGTDIYYPHFEFGIECQTYPFTLAQMERIASLCGKTNKTTFRGFDAGRVLYLGASGRCGPDLVWTLSHKFAVGETLVAVPVSPEIILPYKGAWEYLWCVYKPGAVGSQVAQVPAAAYVERVYDPAVFALPGLGV